MSTPVPASAVFGYFTEVNIFQFKIVTGGYLREGNFTPVPVCDITTTIPTPDRGVFGAENLCFFNLNGTDGEAVIFPMDFVAIPGTGSNNIGDSVSNGINNRGFTSGLDIEYSVGVAMG